MPIKNCSLEEHDDSISKYCYGKPPNTEVFVAVMVLNDILTEYLAEHSSVCLFV